MPTILVAEDDAPVRTLIHRILTREGFDVLCPPNRQMAVEVAAAHRRAFDLLVADVSGTGIDDAEILKQFETLHLDPAVLFLSSQGEPPARCGSCITKPFRPAALVQKIKSLLRRRRFERRGAVPGAARGLLGTV
jgi:DNA-binding response OmpR family regulator